LVDHIDLIETCRLEIHIGGRIAVDVHAWRPGGPVGVQAAVKDNLAIVIAGEAELGIALIRCIIMF